MARFINNAAADDTGLFPNTDPDDEEEEEGNEDGSEMGGFIDDGPEPGSESEREHEPEHEPDLHGSSSPPPLPGKLGQVVARWEAVNASPELHSSPDADPEPAPEPEAKAEPEPEPEAEPAPEPLPVLAAQDPKWPFQSLADVRRLCDVNITEPSRSFFANFTFNDFQQLIMSIEIWATYDPNSPAKTHRTLFSSDPTPPIADVHRIKTQYLSWIIFIQQLGRRRYMEEQGADFDQSRTDQTTIGLDGEFTKCCERTAICVTALGDAVERMSVYRRHSYLGANRSMHPDLLIWPYELRHLLDQVSQMKVAFGEYNAVMGVRKTPQGTMVRERTVISPDGSVFFTGAYEDFPSATNLNLPMTVQDWITDYITQESPLKLDMKARKELMSCFGDHNYPGLQTWLPDRNVWSFYNADHPDAPIYYLFGDPTRDRDGALRMKFLSQADQRCIHAHPCVFFPEPITDDMVAAVLDPSAKFPLSLADTQDANHWWNVLQTPVMDTILTHQLGDAMADQKVPGGPDNPVLAAATVLAMMGRWAFPLNAHDTWQRVMCIMGHAGTGKSLLLTNCMQQWFPRTYVAFLNSRMEATFGLMGLEKAWAIIADEIRDRMGLDPGDFLNIVGGGNVKIRIKNKQSVDVPNWTAPVVMAGNEWISNLKDQRGEIVRRVFIVSFSQAVTGTTGVQMQNGMRQQAGHGLLKCVTAYRCLLDLMRLNYSHGSSGEFNVFADQHLHWFADQARIWIQAKDQLRVFLASGPFLYDGLSVEQPAIDYPDRLRMPFDVLEQMYADYCRLALSNTTGQHRLDPNTCTTAFAEWRLHVTMDEMGVPQSTSRPWPRTDPSMFGEGDSGPMRNAVYILGMDIDFKMKNKLPAYLLPDAHTARDWTTHPPAGLVGEIRPAVSMAGLVARRQARTTASSSVQLVAGAGIGPDIDDAKFDESAPATWHKQVRYAWLVLCRNFRYPSGRIRWRMASYADDERVLSDLDDEVAMVDRELHAPDWAAYAGRQELATFVARCKRSVEALAATPPSSPVSNKKRPRA